MYVPRLCARSKTHALPLSSPRASSLTLIPSPQPQLSGDRIPSPCRIINDCLLPTPSGLGHLRLTSRVIHQDGVAGLYVASKPLPACVTDQLPSDNPFSKRETHSSSSILTYKILTLLSWLLSLVVSVYYTVHEPHDGFSLRNRVWDQNYLYPSAFTMNHVLADIFWFVDPLQPAPESFVLTNA